MMHAQSPAQVDVVIPTRNRGALIEAAITSILASDYTAFTLWVVDQSDNDATEQTVLGFARADSRVRYLRLASHGISAARNSSVAISAAACILFTDDDCRVTAGWIGALVAELSQPGVAATFGRVLPECSEPPPGAQVSPSITMATKTATTRMVYEGNRFNLGFGHGANMAIRRETFDQLGGFDELLGVGGPLRSWEDRDFGYRILAAGGRIVYAPDAVLFHRHWRGWNELRQVSRDYALGAGAAAAKYLRCYDIGGFVVLGEWLLSQGLRQITSGLFKWRSWQKVYVGLQQLIFPWVGLVYGLRYAVDRERGLYQSPQVRPDTPAPSKSTLA